MDQHVVDSRPPNGHRSIDVAVVGGGLAGLAAAIHAARSGARVSVFETSANLGGRARTDQRDGVWFNLGPHALYEGGLGMQVLNELGIDPPGSRPPVRGRVVWRGVESALPVTPGALLTSKVFTMASRLAFARFHARLARLDARSFDSVSVEEFLDDRFGARRSDDRRSDDRVNDARRDGARAMVEGLVRLTTYSDAPALHSAGAAIDQLVLAMAGVRYLDHGWGSLVSSLAAIAEADGVTLVPQTSIDRVEASPAGSAQWDVIDGRGGVWPAAVVVFAGLAPEAVERLTGTAGSGLRVAAGPPVRVACLDLVLADAPKVTFGLDLDDHLYSSLHAPTADLATEGRALLSLARYRRPDMVGDSGTDRASMRAFAQRMGVETTLAERYLHDMTVAQGAPLAARGGLAGRPRVDALGRAGLLIAGDWVGPSGLLGDASLASGREAGRLAARAASELRVA